jgi:excisionase family DNA binding protein
MDTNLTGRGIPRLGLTPDEAALSAAVSRTKIFEAIRAGMLTARKSGKATIIEPSELQRWVRSLPTRGRTPDTPDATSEIIWLLRSTLARRDATA